MSTNDLIKIKSGISQAYWCDTSHEIAQFQPATIAFDTNGQQVISWFDNLFEGGISLPKGDTDILRPLTMLVSGPPGTGKTTLISELCYRLARNEQGNAEPLSTLYISTDAETDRMIQNAVDFGWDDAEKYFIPFDPDGNLELGRESIIGVWGREKFLRSLGQQELLTAMIETAMSSLNQWILKAKIPDSLTEKWKGKLRHIPMEHVTSESSFVPDILVIDSLNILNPEGQTKFFQAFVKACRATKLVIFVLNTGTENQEHKLWEYFSDIVVHLDYQYTHDYYVRTIEVVKARYQSHRWGKHQLKIYPKPKLLSKPSEKSPKNSDEYKTSVQEYNLTMRRSHPYRTAGGVFMFPSIHSYLSVYKRKMSTEKPSLTPTYPEKLNSIFQIPKGRCTAFIGQRGGHKSHLGYLHLLNSLKSEPSARGLILSLREDEATTKKTLANIMKIEFESNAANLDQWEKDNHLEVLYFPPGYITPEEFFHRVFISIQRLKQQGNPVTVIFNSLDQISARFPLCAKEEIFIPGLIQALSGEDVTSICVAVDEPGQPLQQYGLLPMADLIVSFSLRRFSLEDYCNYIGEGWKKERAVDTELQKKFEDFKKGSSNPSLNRDTVVLQVVRFAGGERAGKRGMLELVNDSDLPGFPYLKSGLHFTPISEELTHGESLLKRRSTDK